MYIPRIYSDALDDITNPPTTRRRRFTSHSHSEQQKTQLKNKKHKRKTAKVSRKKNR
jgi:hypothetical protein